MTFDASINLGGLIQTITVVLGGAYFLFSIRFRLDSVEKAMNNLDTEIRKLVDIAIELAKQDQRISNIELRVQELSNRGFYRVARKTK